MKKRICLKYLLCLMCLTGTSFAQPLVVNVTPPSQCYNSGGNSAVGNVVSFPPGSVSYAWNVATPSAGCVSFTTPITPNASSCGFNFPCCGVYTISCLSLNGSNFPTGNFITTVTISCLSLTLSSQPASLVLCGGASATLTAAGATNYTWQPGGGNGSTFVISPTANTCYTVTGSSSSNCTAQAVSCATVQSPTMTVSPSTQSFCPGTTASFTASGASSYTWLPGGSTASTFTVSPTANACYTVIGTNASNCTAQAVACVTLQSLNLTISPPGQNICSGGSASFTASGASTYTWLPGNIKTSTLMVSPMANSCYTVLGNASNCTAQAVACVTLQASSLTVAPLTQSVCVGTAASFTASGANSYTLNTTAVNSTFTIMPLSYTTYTVLGDNGSCVGSQVVTVSVSQNPTISVNSSTTILCKGKTATLTASGCISYTWSGSASTASDLVISPSSTTIYTVTGKNNANCYNTTIYIQTVSICTGIEEVPDYFFPGSVYPNPGNGLFTLKLSRAAEDLHLEVFNTLGELVRSGTLRESSSVIDLSSEPDGLYYVRLKQGDAAQSYPLKLIKRGD